MPVMTDRGIYGSLSHGARFVGMALLTLFTASIFLSSSVSFDIPGKLKVNSERVCQAKSQEISSSWQKTKDSKETAKSGLMVLFHLSSVGELVVPAIISSSLEYEFGTLESSLVYTLTAASDL
jgi:hypothetical protein